MSKATEPVGVKLPAIVRMPGPPTPGDTAPVPLTLPVIVPLPANVAGDVGSVVA